MIRYLDMTFCGDAPHCANRENCHRYFSQSENERAIKWWGDENFPVAFSFFANTCGEFHEDESQSNPTE